MTIFPQKSALKEIKGDDPIPESEKAYFSERLRNRIFNLVADEYARQHDKGQISQVGIARKLAKSPVVINRLLAAPGNWTLSTISDLMLAISAAELDIGVRILKDAEPRNMVGPDWLNAPVAAAIAPLPTINSPTMIKPTPPPVIPPIMIGAPSPVIPTLPLKSTSSYNQVRS